MQIEENWVTSLPVNFVFKHKIPARCVAPGSTPHLYIQYLTYLVTSHLIRSEEV
jgi:hypothetical protein